MLGAEQVTSHYLNQYDSRSLMLCGVAKSQCVKNWSLTISCRTENWYHIEQFESFFSRHPKYGTGDNAQHYNDVIMGAVASQVTSVSIVCSAVVSGADQRKHQSSASLTFVKGIHRSPVNSPHTGPVTRKMFPLHDVIMDIQYTSMLVCYPFLWYVQLFIAWVWNNCQVIYTIIFNIVGK